MSSLSSDPAFMSIITNLANQGVAGVKQHLAQNKSFEKEIKKKYNNAVYGNNVGISEGAQSAMKGISSLLSTYTNSDMGTLGQGTDSLLSFGLNTTPVGIGINVARKGIQAGYKALDINIDTVNKNVWNRQGLSEAARIGNEIMSGIGIMPSIGKVSDAQTLNSRAAGSFGGVASDAADMAELSGKNLLFGLGDTNKRMSEVNSMVGKINAVEREDAKMLNNYASIFQNINNQKIFSGHTPGNSFVLGAKHGGTIPELDEVRSIMQSLQSKKQEESSDTQKFQLGGKMNMIVTGALHARKHNLEELNPVLEGEITKKGIPVITFDEGGEVDQQLAEVEQAEIIMTLDTTKTIEDYYKEYMDADTNKNADKAALECGKFLVDQILKNTDDPDKVIKQTV